MAALKQGFAGMVAVSNATQLKTPVAIINGYSTTGFTVSTAGPTPASVKTAGIKTALAGSLTADTLATALSIAGSGVLQFLGISTVDATSRTMRCKLTLDGVVVFDSTSTANTAGNNYMMVAGALVSAGGGLVYGMCFDAVSFQRSCLFEIASGITETAGLNIYSRYMVS